MTLEPKLNTTEVWIAEHSIRIFLAIALLILVGSFFVVKIIVETSDTANQVKVLSPQVTRINRAICDKRSLEDQLRAARCAERIRLGLVNCRRVERCRAALLAAITYPPPARPRSSALGGGDASAPTGSSQPGRHEGGSGGGEATKVSPGRGGHKNPPENLPPSPGGEPPATTPPASSPAQSPSSTTERGNEPVVVQPPVEPEPPATPSGLTEVLGGVGKAVEEPGPAVEEVGHGVDEVVGGASCQLLHAC